MPLQPCLQLHVIYCLAEFPSDHKKTIPELSSVKVNQAIKNTLKLLATGQTSYQLFENMLQLLLVTVCRHAVLCCTLQTSSSCVICQSMLQDLYSGEAGSPVPMSDDIHLAGSLTHYNYNSQNTASWREPDIIVHSSRSSSHVSPVCTGQLLVLA